MNLVTLTFLAASSLHLQYIPGVGVWLVTGPIPPQQLSCLGMRVPSVRTSGTVSGCCTRPPQAVAQPRVHGYCPLSSASLIVSKILVFWLKSLFLHWMCRTGGLMLSGKGLKQVAVRKLSMAAVKLHLPSSHHPALAQPLRYHRTHFDILVLALALPVPLSWCSS